MIANLLTVAALAASLIYIATVHNEPDRLHYALKPLTTLLIAGIALTIPTPVSDLYRSLIIAGLLASLAGDIFLMLRGERFFAPGLLCFLAAHLLYITAYRSRGDFGFTWWLLLLYAAYCALLVYRLWPSVGSLRIPIIVYAAVLMVMGWQAAEMWLIRRDWSALAAMAGGVLFLLSDSTLALDKFRTPIAQNSVIVMSTYWAAQLLIAWSVRG